MIFVREAQQPLAILGNSIFTDDLGVDSLVEFAEVVHRVRSSRTQMPFSCSNLLYRHYPDSRILVKAEIGFSLLYALYSILGGLFPE